MEAILTRRSIRKYQQQPVPDELITELLRSGMNAPSAGNSQPWHFVVIKDKDLLAQVPKFHQYAHMITEAPVAILVCGDKPSAKYDGIYWVQDCAAATQNILLAAEAKGLGSVWLGIYPLEERVNGLRELLGIPAHITPFALLPVGYPGETKLPMDKFNASKIHVNTW